MFNTKPVPEPFKYKIPKPRRYKSMRRGEVAQETQTLQRYVRGERASEEEYWFAWALDELTEDGTILGYQFQPSYFQRRNVPGEVRLDFLIDIPPELPVQIDGSWIHKSAGQQAKDRFNDSRINDRLSGTALPVVRIPTEPYLTGKNEQEYREKAMQTAIEAIRGGVFI